MLKSFQLIKDPIDYRIINILNERSLSDEEIQKVLNIPITKVRSHLKSLQEMNFVSCDLNTPFNIWHISDCFIEKSPLFYELAILQMHKTPLYQEDLNYLKNLKEKIQS